MSLKRSPVEVILVRVPSNSGMVEIVFHRQTNHLRQRQQEFCLNRPMSMPLFSHDFPNSRLLYFFLTIDDLLTSTANSLCCFTVNFTLCCSLFNPTTRHPLPTSITTVLFSVHHLASDLGWNIWLRIHQLRLIR